MHRRRLLAAIALLPLARPVPAQAVDVTAVNRYLVGLRSGTGRFRQTNPDGSTQTGAFWLQKPGRIRFEYDAPPGAMVIADGAWVGVFDPKSNRGPTRYPLSKTPLSILLRENVSLREPGMVLGATRDGGATRITVVDPRSPQDGRMVMAFSEDPIVLRSWEITTRAGRRTRIDLLDMATGGAFDRSLFNIELATANRR